MNASRLPTKALLKISRATLLAAAALLIGACADVTNPPSSSLKPTDVNKSLVGAVDGVYTVTIDPNTSNTLYLGKSYIAMPAHAVCKLGVSGYGSNYWNSSCTPESNPVTLTAIVRNAQTNHPSVDFSPPMRFAPTSDVHLFIYVTDAATLSNLTVMKYCANGSAACVDESLSDNSLKTTVDKWAGLVSRRIKHFSGYLIAE